MGSPGFDLRSWHTEVDCPLCTYPIWIRMIEVAAQVAVPCPGCKATIWLRDGDGSVHNANENIQREMNNLLRNLRF